MLTISILVVVVLFLIGCNRNVKSSSFDGLFNADDTTITSSVVYAKGFDIYQNEGITKLVIYHPHNHGEIFATYFFVNNSNDIKYTKSPNIIEVPVDSVAVFSATQLNAFTKLGILERVIAISESDYIQNQEVRDILSEGKIVNLASNGNFFLEKTLKLDPNIIFYSPYNLAQKHPLAETMITMIPFFDFMEADPLGRAEWIKFTALFFGKEQLANEIFDTIVNSYNTYKNLTEDLIYRPTVFSDKFFSGQWFVAGGRSYIATLFNDAGAEYLWKDNESIASFNLDFEVVYDLAHNADYWRIVGTYPGGFSYKKLVEENELYENFDAVKNHRVIFCDSRKSSYFETGTLEPHKVLGDLIFAFHPELLPDYKPVYYHLYD